MSQSPVTFKDFLFNDKTDEGKKVVEHNNNKIDGSLGAASGKRFLLSSTITMLN